MRYDPEGQYVQAVQARLSEQYIGFIFPGEDEEWQPRTPHARHKYDGRCAICRAGEYPEALTALIVATLEPTGYEVAPRIR